MAIDSLHPDYAAKIGRWNKNSDAAEGEDAVKSRGETYLVAPGGFTSDDYDRYKMRAKWYGATRRTMQGMGGAVFQKDPDVESSTAVAEQLQNVTLTGISDVLFASRLFDRVLITRYGVLLDFDDRLMRPKWCGYPAASIVNWHETEVDGNPVLSLVVLQEVSDRMLADFTIERSTRYRVLRLNEDGLYEVSIHQLVGRGQQQVMMQTEGYIPTRRGMALDFIPFQFFGAEDLTPAVSRAPLDDLIDVNYAYYRHSADYEHGLFLTGVPTPVVTGHSLDEGQRLPIGSLAAWVFPNPDAKAFLLEYQGHGLQSHERAMTNDKQEMATLGARMLEEQPNTQETLGAVQMRHSGETGSLRSLANLVSEGLTRVLRWHHWWNGDTEQVDDERFSYTLNTDFSTTRLDPQELQALMQLWQAGAISKETLFWNLKQGEIIPAENEYEDEEGMIEVQEPARIPFGEEPVEEPEPEPEEEDTEEVAA